MVNVEWAWWFFPYHEINPILQLLPANFQTALDILPFDKLRAGSAQDDRRN